jgi:hypothetical protein
MYEYEYLYEDIHKCSICKNYIELKYCVLVGDGKKYYFHKSCFVKLIDS